MKLSSPIARGPAALLLVAFLSLVRVAGADNPALKAEIEAFRKGALEQFKDRKPDNFEDYVRDTATRNFYQRQFTAAITNGNAVAVAGVLKEFPEFARPQFLNGAAVQGKSALLYAVERGHREVVELLLAQKVGADAPRPASMFVGGPFGRSSARVPPGYGENRDTPLHVAVRAGNTELAKLLLGAGANVEALDSQSASPLYTTLRKLGVFGSYAAVLIGSEEHGRQEQMLILLLRSGAQVMSTNRFLSDRQALHGAAAYRRDDTLDQLLTNCVHLASTNLQGESLVHMAVNLGRTNALRSLLAKAAPANLINVAGFTPLRQAAWLPLVPGLPVPSFPGGTVHIEPIARAGVVRQQSADLLLAAGAEPDAFVLAGLNRTNELAALLGREATRASARDPFGRSPLHYAVNGGSTSALRLLLATKAETEARDRSGQTPLLQALAQRRPIEATDLLAAGALVTATNATGQAALHLAITVGGDTNFVALLVAAGADVNGRDAAGRTPVELAAVSQRFDLVQWLEANGAIATPRAERLMTTPLHQATAQGILPLMLHLLTKGADVNARNEQGLTPIALAVGAGRADIVMTLLTNGANVNLPDTNGVTPLRARFLAANDPVPDPVPKPGFSKHPAAPNSPKATVTRADTLPPELRPPSLAGQPPLGNLLLLLLENGADPKIADAKGDTILHALHPPRTPPNDFPVKPVYPPLPEAIARVRLLANYGLAPDTRANNGLTPLHAIAIQGNLVHAFALLEAGAGVNTPDQQGRTALHHALLPPPSRWRMQDTIGAHRDRPHLLALLLDNGADLRRADTNGATPLHLLPAMDESLRDLVLPALKTNRHFAAALRLKNKAGQTPVLLAFGQVRTNPVPSSVKMLATLLDNGGEMPSVTEQGSTSLLHELAGIGVIGHPFYGAGQPDAEGTAMIARMTSNVVARAAGVDVRNAKGETPLHAATRAQNAGFAAALMARGANANAQDLAGDTPLHLALRAVGPPHYQHAVIPLLVSNRCDLARRNAAGESPLRLELTRRFYIAPLFLPPGATQSFFPAARAGDVPSLDAYLNLDSTLATAVDPLTQVSALRAAAQAGQTAVAERLRNAGATDVLSAALLGWTNSLAAFVHTTPGLGATQPAFGMPLLHSAASRGQLAAVQLLLTPEVAPGLADGWGRTALFHATTNGSTNVVAWLAARGARHSVFDAIALGDLRQLGALLEAVPGNANATNGQTMTALLFAMARDEKEIVRRLLAAGADPDGKAGSQQGIVFGGLTAGTVPLHLAAWSNRVDLAELLGRAKASAAMTNSMGYAALHFAAARGHIEMAEWLLAHGANPNAPGGIPNPPPQPGVPSFVNAHFGWTPLHLAVRHGHSKMIELLVAKGAKLDATESMGRTPADLLQRSADMMMPSWPPSPYRGPSPGIPAADVHRDPARAAEVTETLRKLGAVIPSTRGAIFNNRSLPPGFPGQPGFPVPAPGIPPAPKR
ncbi:MAG: ankyrin repeat domain-containing protein [Limisphaerales bacterium]